MGRLARSKRAEIVGGSLPEDVENAMLALEKAPPGTRGHIPGHGDLATFGGAGVRTVVTEMAEFERLADRLGITGRRRADIAIELCINIGNRRDIKHEPFGDTSDELGIELATSKCPESLESIKLLETRVERGRDEFDSSEEYARACLELGDCYMYGFRGWERDFERACDMYFEASEEDFPEAQICLAEVFRMNLEHDGNLEVPAIKAMLLAPRTTDNVVHHLFYLLGESAKCGHLAPMLLDMTGMARQCKLRPKDINQVKGLPECLQRMYKHERVYLRATQREARQEMGLEPLHMDFAAAAEAERLRLEGNDLFRSGAVEAAAGMYTQALNMLDKWELWGLYVEGAKDTAAFEAICETIMRSQANRAECSLKLQQWEEAKQDCKKALNMAKMYGPFEGVTDDMLKEVRDGLQRAIISLVDLARRGNDQEPEGLADNKPQDNHTKAPLPPQPPVDEEEHKKACCVCLEGDRKKWRLKVTPCGHCLHVRCAAKWKTSCQRLGRDYTCPMCRETLK